ncbi:MAG: roadblock/LC7 domain-containing protein [Acidobacteriota bacterium]|nr:roadblock/LC7 domain-containing protein [Acidobacteriota bacterium]
MEPSTFDLHESEFRRIEAILSRVRGEVRAELALLVSRSGQAVAAAGAAEGVDDTALASLATAALAASDGLARLVGEDGFPALAHQGVRRSVFISDLMRRYALVLVFDAAVSAGLVRYKCKRAALLVEDVLRGRRRAGEGPAAPGGLKFSDDELEALLGE